ncbi:hypothetical protein M407DRAFT_107197 [Tulasnella calospora MUT 4182]|uniref:Uncharacterized protein n=1 Tax=Tulasnella calospora MUT 4182 TaxID=1051891 RepID=A0A0C3KQQ0_9AGAM|nr:hypothetical protein M407DRAFT_107197 [Tulasnella calospora MUT 4182]
MGFDQESRPFAPSASTPPLPYDLVCVRVHTPNLASMLCRIVFCSRVDMKCAYGARGRLRLSMIHLPARILVHVTSPKLGLPDPNAHVPDRRSSDYEADHALFHGTPFRFRSNDRSECRRDRRAFIRFQVP